MADISYTPTTWADGAEGGTPIDAAKLNNIESGIVDAVAAIGPNDTTADGTLKAQIDALGKTTGTATINNSTVVNDYGNSLTKNGAVVEFVISGMIAYGAGKQIATLPEGFRPLSSKFGVMIFMDGKSIPVIVNNAGNVGIAASYSGANGTAYGLLNLVYSI